ncbi:PhnD/SsuA/transferrin family substrate-binding protein [Alisedimentitalea sp. MJ-SS2]|uniref:PhnD/SsuA/transferrin family substrate-binding protein n=1 Tax=Aliisedimentitalea sp. MJ-SS2 TaxID=3049795 RepID=UPI0029152906|nr:PhnD/SsuA/transferrin family substrate-binding protein [Alisedimentitalea sp. MJ-SS2]MDU8928867.1 PhnD/SsuA/transferrin family substrate-binding protein [Alisedimentitalea sp. MJ-SS2]
MRFAWRWIVACGLALATIVLPALNSNAQNNEPDGGIRVGILAHRGSPGVARYWTPLQTYLSATLDQPVEFVPVTLASAGPLIETGALHFLITNPGHYVALERQFPMSVIATLHRRLSDGSQRSEFGSTIITATSSDISTLKDSAGRHVTAVDPRAFGGFQVAWREFTAQDVDPFSDFAELAFVGFPQDRIIDDVLAGKTDIGIIRSGLIETMAAEGRLDPARLRVLNANANFTFPDAVSTRLYPEWPFLALAGTQAELRDRTALALLQTQLPRIRATHALRDGWGAPLSYHSARSLDAAYIASTDPTTGSTTIDPTWFLLIPATALLTAFLVWLQIRRGRKPAPDLVVSDDPMPTQPPVQLTQRESEILTLVTDGMSSKEIARQLGISPKTVEFHRSNLLKKYEAKSVVDLVRMTANLPENPQT